MGVSWAELKNTFSGTLTVKVWHKAQDDFKGRPVTWDVIGIGNSSTVFSHVQLPTLEACGVEGNAVITTVYPDHEVEGDEDSEASSTDEETLRPLTTLARIPRSSNRSSSDTESRLAELITEVDRFVRNPRTEGWLAKYKLTNTRAVYVGTQFGGRENILTGARMAYQSSRELSIITTNKSLSQDRAQAARNRPESSAAGLHSVEPSSGTWFPVPAALRFPSTTGNCRKRELRQLHGCTCKGVHSVSVSPSVRNKIPG